MADFSAIELEAREISPALNTRTVAPTLEVVSGVLFSAALFAAGIVLVPLALMLGVVGSPLIVLALAYVVARRRLPAQPRPAVSLAGG